ncbi:hypothetical protein GCM10009769_11750 [Curtobacterium luteum]|uniref:TIR domain-containing protein n=1 Tax=Curtobacterium luteum TaxID=33881 RepID=A0A8H9L1Q7_9MICO|nr:tetratricopeptide repeat protein [Curtobacterium luteum]GGK95320.1 hypothetical protein GCM10009769_11750 [Curtobacterium luteum]
MNIGDNSWVGGKVSKRFFISHASPEKHVALELKAKLDGDAWVDLHEIDLGDLLLEEISSGSEEATDFVLLWSATSAASRWVSFELHMAFIRWLEDNAVAIRIICLDDTKVPLYLRPFLQARGKRSAEEIAAVLMGTVPPKTARRVFFNRNTEIGRIEEALYSPDRAAAFICGMPGSGKRSLAREALSRLTVGSGTIRRVSVTAGTAEPELNLLVTSALGLPPAAENTSPEDVMKATDDLMGSFMDEGGIWVFEDVEHWLEEDGVPGRILANLLATITRASDWVSRLVIFTTRRRPTLHDLEDSVDAFFLTGLAKQHAIPLLRAQGAVGEESELGVVAEELDGHPLALEVVAPRLPLPAAALREQRHTIATDLVDPNAVSATAWRLLEALALVDGPVPAEDLASFLRLSADDMQDAIAQAVQYSLVANSDEGTLALHPLLRDYFLRSFRKQENHVGLTSELADLMKRRLDRVAPGEAGYVPTLLATVKLLGLAGRFDEARSLRTGLIGTLYQTAVELYQEKRYEEALLYIDEAITGAEESDLALRQLQMKTLAYLGNLKDARSIGDDLVRMYPQNAAVLRDRGRVEFIARNWGAAISYFQRAIPFRHNPAQLWSDIAQARMRMSDWNGAAVAAQASIAKGGDTPWTLALYSEALEHLQQLSEAEEVMTRAVTREPNNPAYRHRLGRIALQTGHRQSAIEQFKRSVELDSSFVQSWLSLASALADDGDLEGAQRALAVGRDQPGSPAAVAQNVQAKIHLVMGDLEAAQQSIDSALEGRRDGQNLALAVRICIARAESGLISTGQARARIRALALELDALKQLRFVLDYSREFPKYFD